MSELYDLSKVVGIKTFHKWSWKINLRCCFCQSKEDYYKESPLGRSKGVMPIFVEVNNKLVAVLICEDCFNKAKDIMMKCPSCNNKDICISGTTFQGKDYDRACNKCGYVWNSKEKESK